MIKKIVLFVAIVIALLFISSRVGHSTPTLPANQTINKSGVWLQNYTESSWFVWNSELYYIYNERPLTGATNLMHIIKPTFTNGKITSQTEIATFGSGYGCMDALADSGTLYVVATNCKMDFSHTGNSIVMFTSTNLTTWSGPSTIYTVENSGQIYNVTLASTGSNFTIGYEIHNPSWYSQYFLIRFLTASSLSGSWTGAGDTHTLLDQSCPDLKYSNGKYYIWTGHGASTIVSTTTSLATSTINWTTSVIPTLKATEAYESLYDSDPDLIEFSGTTYILYAAGDQSTFERLNYATYSGTLAQLIDAYQQPN